MGEPLRSHRRKEKEGVQMRGRLVREFVGEGALRWGVATEERRDKCAEVGTKVRSAGDGR